MTGANPRISLLHRILPFAIQEALAACLGCPQTHRNNSVWQLPVLAKPWEIPNRRLVAVPEPRHRQSPSCRVPVFAELRGWGQTHGNGISGTRREGCSLGLEGLCSCLPLTRGVCTVFLSFYLVVYLLSYMLFAFKQTCKTEQAWISLNGKMSPHSQMRTTSFTIPQRSGQGLLD